MSYRENDDNIMVINDNPLDQDTNMGINLVTISSYTGDCDAATMDYNFDWSTIDSIDLTPSGSNKITLDGNDADIVVNGVSLNARLERIEQHLAIVSLNPELEKEWHQLRQLGDQYRALEKSLLEKTSMWETLQKT